MTEMKAPSARAIELAKKLYAEAKANGTLKTPRPIAASMGRLDGVSHSVKACGVTWSDYLVDANRALRPRI